MGQAQRDTQYARKWESRHVKRHPTYARRAAYLVDRLDLRPLLLRESRVGGWPPPLFTPFEQLEIKRALEPIIKAAIARAAKRRPTAMRSAPGRPARGKQPYLARDVIAALCGTSASTLARHEKIAAKVEANPNSYRHMAYWSDSHGRDTRLIKGCLERLSEADKKTTPCVRGQIGRAVETERAHG